MAFFKLNSGVGWIVAFLGNPGSKYENTRHNIGFMAGDILASKLGVRLNRLRFKAMTGQGKIAGEKVLLMKPQTFMNLSGISVAEAMKFYKLPAERILVVTDDTALSMGDIRIRRKGSAGGHNGLKSIIEKCGGEDFPRVKIGVGSPKNPHMDLADWVLQSFKGKDLDQMKKTAELAADAVASIISTDIDSAMAKFN